MSITAQRLEVDVSADTSNARRELDGFSRATGTTGKYADQAGAKAGSMGKKFSAAAMLVKAAAGTMVASVGAKTIMAASDLNEVLSKTGVVFGPQAKRVTDAAQEMADQFGISKKVYLDAASGIGLVGKASGLTQKAAAGLSTDFAALAADASSFYDVPIEEALAAMKSGLVGESEPMRQFGVLLSEAAVKTEAVRLGLAKTGDELTEGQKVQARSSLIMKGMSDASGDLERTQESVANRVRELQGRLTNFAADMGTKALPAVEKFLTALIEGPQAIADFYNGLKDWTAEHPILTKAIQVTGIAITAVFIPAMVKAGVAAVAMKVKAVAAFIATQAAAVRSAAAVSVAMVRNIAFYVQYGAVVAAQMAKTAASWVMMQARAAAAGVAHIALLARMAAAYVLNGVKMAATMAATAARTVAAWVLMGAQSMIQAARMAAAWVVAMGPVGWAIAAAAAVAVAIYQNWDKIVAFTKAAWTRVSAALSSAWNGIKAGASAALGFLKNLFLNFTGPGLIIKHWDKIKAATRAAWNAVTGAVSSGMGRVKGFITGGMSAAQGAITGAWNAAKSATVRMWNGIVSAVTGGVAKAMGVVRSIQGKITGFFAGAGTWLLDAGKNIINGLTQGIKDMVGNAVSAVKDAGGAVIDAAKGAFKIFSPSRVFRAIGRYLPEGLALGIRDMTGKAARQGKEMASRVIRAAADEVKRRQKDLFVDLSLKVGKGKGALKAAKEDQAERRKAFVEPGREVMAGLKEGLGGEWPEVQKHLQEVNDWVAKTFTRDLEAGIRKATKTAHNRLRQATADAKRLATEYANAVTARDQLAEQKSSAIQTISGGFSAPNVLNAGNNASTIRESVQAYVAKAREFAASLRGMAKMGYSKAVVLQVAGQGIEQGTEVAKALAAASFADMSGINQGFADVEMMATDVAADLGAGWFDAGLTAAENLIRGIESQQAAAIAVADEMGRQVGAAIQRAIAQAQEATAAGVKDSAKGGGGAGKGKANGVKPANTSGNGKGKGSVVVAITNHNPRAEATSQTVNKTLSRVAALGLV